LEHLIPKLWFVGLPQWLLLLWVVISMITLIKGADWLVDGAAGLAFRMGISKVIVGATVISLGTPSPEAAVSVMAAFAGEPGLALGNAVGSIIADTGLIFGLGCMLAVLPADRFVLSRQGWVQFGVAVLLAVLCYGDWILTGDQAKLGRVAGLFLLSLLVVYMYVSVKWSREHPISPAIEEVDKHANEKRSHRAYARLALLVLAGLMIVIFSSRVMILSVAELAEVHWRVPKVVIAATLVALGTSMPELVIGLTSIFKGHREILVGNVIGADILNVLFVVGAAATAAPLPLFDFAADLPGVLLVLHIPTMLIILLLFRIFIFRATKRGHFRRWYGVPLVLIYIAYTILQYVVTT
jgi:cation:H+ antiporter